VDPAETERLTEELVVVVVVVVDKEPDRELDKVGVVVVGREPTVSHILPDIEIEEEAEDLLTYSKGLKSTVVDTRNPPRRVPA